MSNETDISAERKWLYQERARIVVTNLQKRNINAQYVSARAEALYVVMEMIPEGATVVRGDSQSLDQIGIIPALRKRNQNKVLDPFEWDADGNFVVGEEERGRMHREAFFADVFLASTNAVTLDGKLVSIDGMGNRVAAMIFGPEKVILVVGANKIVKDLNAALERMHEVCAPITAKWHSLEHHRSEFEDLPCVRTGRCVDCNNDWRVCRSTVIIEGTWAPVKGRINVVLVGEELGI